MTLVERLAQHAATSPQRTALSWPGGRYSYAELLAEIALAAELLRESNADLLALDIDNGPAWVALDIAALQLGICVIPLPPFFSGGQLRHLLQRAGVQLVISEDPERLFRRAGLQPYGLRQRVVLGGRQLVRMVVDRRRSTSVPAGIHKITFTSGTTGEPKGVMLSWRQMRPVVESLAQAAELQAGDRHLALMPLAVLLENIGGVYAPLWAGARVEIPPVAQAGMTGSSQIDAELLQRTLEEAGATSAIFTPQIVLSLVERLERSPGHRLALRFAAVGGAPMPPRLLQRAAAVGLPIFEGYGLSECASVVCLNTPRHNRPGSVGKPLPHVRLRIADDGEILLGGAAFAGYLGERPPSAEAQEYWPSGDLGELDSDGFLYLHGRRRNIFISAFGRNIAPEWVEHELTLEPEIAQVAVFGEARPFVVAVVVAGNGATPVQIDAALMRSNRSLPDYAQVTRWISADAPFSHSNGMLTGTGRIRRSSVYRHYRQSLESLYCEA
ncbi:MAG: AMP-binding protein [Gammaproteobacteria bacterium]|nr:AMP-binding protein [Gammaproteobacteria bacterium]